MILDLLVALLVVVAAILALALLMPVHAGVSGAVDDDGADWRARVGWAFGLLSVEAGPDGASLRVVGIRVARLGRSAKASERRAKRRRQEKRPGRRGPRWLLGRRRMLMGILRRYVRALHLRGRVEGVVGLPEPDQSAVLHQGLMALDALLPEGVLAVEVDWVEEVVLLEGRLRGWIWPLQVAWITVGLFVNGETRRALRAA